MRVPVYERQVGINPMPGARVNAPGNAGAYGAGIGAAIGGAAERIGAIAQDMEDAKTLELFNAFKRESAEYHEHPDKGIYNTRVGSGAWNVTKDADEWLEQKANEYAKKAPGARARQNFQRMAGQHREQMFGANSRFEAGQIKKYRESEADAAIQTGLDEIAQNYDNDEAIERIKQGMDEAVAFKVKGMGPEAVKSAYAELDDKIAMTRLARMLEDDPEKAEEWFYEHKEDFGSDGLIRAEKAVNTAMERLTAERKKQAVYGIANDYWDKYGKADMETRDAIYSDENLTDEEKDFVWRRLEAREADIERQEKQDEINYKNGWINKIIEGSSSYEEAMQFVADSGASGAERLQLERLVKQVWQPEKFKESITDWAQAFTEIKEGRFNSTDEIIYRWGGRLKASTLQGLVRMFYTGSTSVGKGGSGGGIEYVGYSFSKAIENTMKALDIDQGTADAALFCTILGKELEQFRQQHGRDANPTEKQAMLNEYVKTQPVSARGIKSYMGKIAKQMGFELSPVYGMFGAISGYDYVKPNGDGTFTTFDPSMAYDYAQVNDKPKEREPLPPLPPLQYGQSVIKTGAGRENRGERPRMMPDGTPFPNRRPAANPQAQIREMPQRVKRQRGNTPDTGDIGLDVLGGAKAPQPKNGHYGAPRDSGKRTHHGQDYSIVAGTAVKAPELGGVKMTVSGVGYDKTSGNKLHLSGKHNGHTFRLFMCHFQDGSISVKNGQTVTGGALLAKVGSTGHSGGPHLHIETFIDGKRVDPKEFYKLIG